ncbi:MAG: hypothetical protein VX642_13460 [Bdellovibrionota bacterium]|nr:hypothetical protein [Bdellovibrionota bacterium]
MSESFNYLQLIKDFLEEDGAFVMDKYKGSLPKEIAIGDIVKKVLDYGMEDKFIDEVEIDRGPDGQYLVRKNDYYISFYRERGTILEEQRHGRIESGLEVKLRAKFWWL